VACSNGPQWKAHRDFAKSLFTADHLRSVLPTFSKYSGALMQQLESRRGDGPVDMQDMFFRFTMASFGEIGFGTHLRALEEAENRFVTAATYRSCASPRLCGEGTSSFRHTRGDDAAGAVAVVSCRLC
jgi:cytochrome P450